MTEGQPIDLLWPPAARAAAAMPSRLYRTNETFWQDICEVLLDPEAEPQALETVRRWLRDQVAGDLMNRLRESKDGHLTSWACRLAPRMTWKLPCSIGPPPARFRRRIVALILPHKLARLERQLARLAFSWQMRVAGPTGKPGPPP